jgi:hypothetical protein
MAATLEAAERGSDLRVLRSVIDFVNALDFQEMDAMARTAWLQPAPAVFTHLEWVGAAMADRAASADIAEAREKWHWDDSPKGRVESSWKRARYAADKFRWVVRYLSGDRRAADDRAFADVIDYQLRHVPIYTRIRFCDGRAVRQSVPVLRNVLHCTAYAVALMAEDRWGLRGRVRECPFIPRGHTQSHLFLDDSRLSETAAQQGKARVYCSSSHGSADRKRRFDARNA